MKFDLMNGHLANRKTVDANPLRDLKKKKKWRWNNPST